MSDQLALLPGLGGGASECRICHRVLTNAHSRATGIGPVCASKTGGPMTTRTLDPITDLHDLPFDPATRDITCQRVEIAQRFDDGPDGTGTRTTLHFNIPRRHVDHSPSGWEFGYGGSGPSDYALNILAVFIGPAPEPLPMPGEDAPAEAWDAWEAAQPEAPINLWDGTYVHRDVWSLHQAFKAAFVATLPREGGTIPGAAITAWLAEHREGEGS